MKNLLVVLLFFSFLFTHSQVRIGSYDGDSHAVVYNNGWGQGNSYINIGIYSGESAGSNGTYFTNVGPHSARYNSDMDFNVNVGYAAGYRGSNAIRNVAIGSYAMFSNSGSGTTGDNNTSVGHESMYKITSGYDNSGLGYQSLYGLTTGYRNLAAGGYSGDILISGTYNTFLGFGTDASSASAINQTAIGYAADGQANNSVTLGNSDVTAVYMAEDSGATVYAAGLNLGSTAVTSTAAELNYVDGVTSNVQTQLDAKQTTISASNRINANLINDGNISNTEFGYLNGLSSDIQTQLDAKNATINSGNRLDADLINDGSISNTEYNYLNGVTSAIQTQLDGSGILSSVTESGNTGVRLSTSSAANHGNIGSNAVDLSYSGSSSSTKGATGSYAVAMGRLTTASGIYSTAIGYNTTSTATYAVAMGGYTTASGIYSTAMGRQTTAIGYGSTAMGYVTTASGSYSTATGFGSTASDFGSTVIGQYNSSGSSVTNSASSFNTANTAFVIGNGTASNAKSDAFKVMFNGDAIVSNDLTVSGDVVVSSDARLKSNIVSLGSTLSRILLIDGKS